MAYIPANSFVGLSVQIYKETHSYGKLIMMQRWSRGHKVRGQGQGHKKNPRPRPRTAFPRTDPLEAKDRNARGQDQGHRRKRSPKKKVLQKSFPGSLQFIGVATIFDWEERPKSQLTCNDVIKNFQKSNFLWDKDIMGCKT